MGIPSENLAEISSLTTLRVLPEVSYWFLQRFHLHNTPGVLLKIIRIPPEIYSVVNPEFSAEITPVISKEITIRGFLRKRVHAENSSSPSENSPEILWEITSEIPPDPFQSLKLHIH